MIWFRYVARDPRTGETTADVERFADEVAARATLAKRGWHEILELTETTAPGSDAPPPRLDPATVIGVDGRWSYIDAASAMRHPLHGKGGWCVMLGIGLVLTPLLNASEVVGHDRAGNLGWIGVTIIPTLIAYQVVAAVLFFRTSESFPLHFMIATMCMMVPALIGLPFVESAREAVGVFRQAIVSVVWITYVRCSRRANVTFRSRLRAGDPMLPPTT